MVALQAASKWGAAAWGCVLLTCLNVKYRSVGHHPCR
jgi:hypothetical protein